jgi:hypothetical protein
MSGLNDVLSIPLSGLRFKGDRNYLHGTDILPAALKGLIAEQTRVTDIDIVFHALAKAGLTMTSSVPPGAEPKVKLSCNVDGKRTRFFLIEDGRPIAEHYGYPEEEIVAKTDIRLDTDTATNSAPLPFTNIERWIAMVKALHQATYSDLNGKWLFVRGKFDRYQDTYDAIVQHQVVIKGNFDNRLTRSDLLIDGHKLGEIFFALT